MNQGRAPCTTCHQAQQSPHLKQSFTGVDNSPSRHCSAGPSSCTASPPLHVRHLPGVLCALLWIHRGPLWFCGALWTVNSPTHLPTLQWSLGQHLRRPLVPGSHTCFIVLCPRRLCRGRRRALKGSEDGCFRGSRRRGGLLCSWCCWCCWCWGGCRRGLL